MFLKKFFIEGADFLKQIYLNKFIIWELTKRDFRTKYISNLLGLSWAILEPLAMMVILWFVFTYIRTGQKTEVPYALFLLAGLISYDFFNKSLNSATRGISSYGFLINKVNFRAAIIPLVKISSEILMHFIILVIVAVILALSSIPITIYWIQILYYLFATVFLLTGISWFTSSISLFFPDIKYIITIVMRVLFFFTPIFWEVKNIPEHMLIYFRLNPLYYIVRGYRDSFLYNVPFWKNPVDTIYFWIISIVFFIIGVMVFKRLRPYFAEMV